VKEYVKPEGHLIYSTCTIHKEENMGNVHWFLERYPEFQLVSIKERLCEELQGDVEEDGCLQLLPGVHNSDGFFIAKFKRMRHG
jgi:16S rRNA (cytosine967-C5)-methyltransferase